MSAASALADRGTFDAVVVGGGHNGLTAAANLARAGRTVLVLEQREHLGGATQSVQAFPGLDARVSRYSYLVSLMPRAVRDELGLDLTLRRRRISSYTPVPGDPTRGLLVDTGDLAATARSFGAVGAASDLAAWGAWGERTAELARAVFPTLTEPLPSVDRMRRAMGEQWWQDLVERPLGEVVERMFASDVVRGVVLTDALIGTFAGAHEASLVQNRCFLYHVIGGGTGDWDVPVGGMGAVLSALEGAVRGAGGEIRTGARATAVDPDGGGHVGRRRRRGASRRCRARGCGVQSPGARPAARRGTDLPVPGRRAAQGQHAPDAAAPAQGRRRRPAGHLRRDLSCQRGLRPARAGARRGGRRPHPGAATPRDLLPLAHRPIDPGSGPGGHPPHADPLRAAHAREALP